MKRPLYFIVTLIAMLFLPQLALAQSVNVLNPPAIANGTDLSIQYLADIFGVVDGVLHGSGSQIMGHMFAVLNAGALVLGGIIIMYTLIVSTLNTAHEGTPLGKDWSSLWIPIKAALGIALLLPKATGYSIIQIFMMWIIVQGVAVADSVWDSALIYLGSGGMVIQQELPPPSNMAPQAANILQSQVCMYALQAALQQAYQDATKAGNQPTSGPVPQFVNTVTPIPVPDPTSPPLAGQLVKMAQPPVWIFLAKAVLQVILQIMTNCKESVVKLVGTHQARLRP